jgi:hypothetical protein
MKEYFSKTPRQALKTTQTPFTRVTKDLFPRVKPRESAIDYSLPSIAKVKNDELHLIVALIASRKRFIYNSIKRNEPTFVTAVHWEDCRL